MTIYAGIGSRRTSPDVLRLMTRISREYAAQGLVLRSGGAEGADKAFEAGAFRAGGRVETWNPRASRVLSTPDRYPDWAHRELAFVAEECAPANMGDFVRSLLLRNMYQIFGEDGATPVSFVVCWTPTEDPCSPDAGGTRYAVRAARRYDIPIYNLRLPEVRGIFEGGSTP